jgi:hypothetical protein
MISQLEAICTEQQDAEAAALDTWLDDRQAPDMERWLQLSGSLEE